MAASLCLVCVGVAAVWSVLQYGSESGLPEEGYSLQEQPMKSEGEDGQSYDVKTDGAHQENDNSGDGAGTILFENTNTDVSLEYVTELQTKVSSAMMSHEVPFVISSSVYENPYRLHVVVTSNAEEDL